MDDETVCVICTRKAARMNSAVAECSHIDCPHRRACWADGTGYAKWVPPKPDEWAGERLFDKTEV